MELNFKQAKEKELGESGAEKRLALGAKSFAVEAWVKSKREVVEA